MNTTMVSGTRPVILLAVARDRSVSSALAANGYEVVQPASIAQVLLQLHDTRPDLIVVDANLPDMSGIDACALLRRDPHVNRHVPILMLAPDKPTPEQRVTALRAGAWDFLRYPGDRDEFSLKLETYVQAKRNLDDALADGMIDPTTGLHSRPGLARRARELGALMARHHGALACVVFALDAKPADPRAGSLVAHTARICDVVGALGPSEFAVLAPATDDAGALKLARRIAGALCAAPGGSATDNPVPTLRVGYDAVANLKYSPIDPAGLLARAAAAVRTGRPEPGYPWVRRFDVNAGVDDEGRGGARISPLGLMLHDTERTG